MAICDRCGLRLINVMQMGAHRRRCKLTALAINESNLHENLGDATNIPDTSMLAETESEADVHEPDATPVVINTPVTSLQSLARREKKTRFDDELIVGGRGFSHVCNDASGEPSSI